MLHGANDQYPQYLHIHTCHSTAVLISAERISQEGGKDEKTPLIGQRRPALPRTTPQYHRRSGA